MYLGDITRVDPEVKFEIGPGTTGPGKYEQKLPKKWVWIRCAEEEVSVCIRDRESELESPLTGDSLDVWRESFFEVDKLRMQRDARRQEHDKQ